MSAKTVRTTLALPADLLAAIDAAFAAMADDAEYQEEARRIAREFAGGDWEAFHQAESR